MANSNGLFCRASNNDRVPGLHKQEPTNCLSILVSERYYTSCPLMPGPVELTGPEAHHLAVVCRLRAGDQVCLFNGDGHQYPARIVEAGKRSVALEVLSRESPQRELPFALTVAVPLPKGDRAQFLVEKLTEIGVTTFVPLSTQRSVVQPREAKLEKLQRHVIEASKQCGRNVLMEVAGLHEWESYCRQQEIDELRLLAHPGQGGLPALRPAALMAKAVKVAIGPEGGFTDDEAALAEEAGWQLRDMGPRILRVETAAIVLAAWVIAWQD
jgi:16S rRNA (uracil1498-N3)-methyltransferase